MAGVQSGTERLRNAIIKTLSTVFALSTIHLPDTFIIGCTTSRRRALLMPSSDGSQSPISPLKKLEALPWPDVPPYEQERIAAYLDASCAAIDAAVDIKRHQIETLEALCESTLARAVTVGLGRETETVDMDSTVVPKSPLGWRLARLKAIATVRYGLGQPPSQLDSGVPMIRATDVDAGHIRMDNFLRVDPEELPRERNLYLKSGEIIVVRSGAYTGDSAIVPPELEGCIIGYDMVVTVTRASSRFVAYCLLSRYVLEGQIKLLTLRAAQPHLNAEQLGSVLLALPPTQDEQEAIANFLDAKLAEIRRISQTINSQIETLTAYRKSLIHECVTGQRRISEADVRRVCQDSGLDQELLAEVGV